ncbi:copper-binding protein [Sphingomonas histidinilytica]|uniref:copper-binding protein n=1 Tax=Rhizorhabdus histidinilytica TaxID=439228 RepID=UPI001ADD3AC9|nr:copper-binding protein [Rhizorhabdus histidinilytica]MBO9378131.1 copper-binding protein [Rhizorhabdus histidinilytica]
MKSLTLAAMLGLSALLAACGQKAETNDAAANATSEATGKVDATAGNMSGDMGTMEMPLAGAAKMAKGTGTVTAVDKSAGTITLDHGPIAEANWPAMTMAFKAKPELIDSVKVGDKVAFDIALKDGAGEVTTIQKQ